MISGPPAIPSLRGTGIPGMAKGRLPNIIPTIIPIKYKLITTKTLCSLKNATVKYAEKLTGLSIGGSRTITAGKSVTLKPVYTPSDTKLKGVTWKSSNKAVASVNSKGKVVCPDLDQIRKPVKFGIDTRAFNSLRIHIHSKYT